MRSRSAGVALDAAPRPRYHPHPEMTRAEITERVIGILVKTFELDRADIRLESKLYEELDLDSIDAVDMFVELHEITGRRIDPEVARKIRTVQDIVDLVEAELRPPAGG